MKINLHWFYQLGSLPFFYSLSQKFWRWLLPFSVLLVLLGWIWGLAFVPPDYLQKNSFRIIYVHVPAAFLAQSLYLLLACSAFIYLIWRIKLYMYLMRSCIPLGLLFTLLALASGSIWGKPTWGTFWVWGDARLLSVAVLLFFYLGLQGLDQALVNKTQANKAIALLALVGLINIPIIKYSVDWWFTLHQPASLKLGSKPSIAPVMLWPLLLSIAGYYLFALALLCIKAQCLIMQQEAAAKCKWLKTFLVNKPNHRQYTQSE